MVLALLKQVFQYHAMLQPISIRNFKNVYHVLMDVWAVKTVMIVLNVDLIIHLILKLAFVLKYVVMEKDILQIVMMEITSMVMDAVEIVKLKSDSLAMEAPQVQKILAVLNYQLQFQFKTEDNQDYSEKLY